MNGLDVVLNLYAAGGSAVGVMLNQGGGALAAPVRYPATCPAGLGLALTDLNVDGKTDAVLACYGPLNRLFGDGAGHFGPGQAFSYGSNGNSAPSVEAAQITGFGADELVFHTLDAQYRPIICFAYADDRPGAAPTCGNNTTPRVAPEPSFLGGEDLHAANFGAARDAIVVASGSEANKFAVFGREPGTNFNSWTDVNKDAGGPVRSLLAKDIDGDGDTDVVVGHGSSTAGSLSVQINRPGIPSTQLANTFPTILDPQALGVADFDGDGKPDLVAASGYGKLAIHAGNGDGTFGPPQEVPLPGYGDPAFATAVNMAVGDLTGDGKPDIVVADNLNKRLSLLTNTSAFPTPPPPPPPPTPPSPKPQPIVPPAPGPKPNPFPAGGLQHLLTSLTLGSGSSLVLGAVANPPTASTTQKLVVTVAGASARRRRPAFVTVASGRTKVPAGRTRPLALRLTPAGRRLLAKHRVVKARLVVVATGRDGRRATVTRRVTLKRRARARR